LERLKFQYKEIEMKSGVKTTEFWLGLFAVVLPYLNKELNLGLDTLSIIAAVSSVVAYIISRTAVKIANSRNE